MIYLTKQYKFCAAHQYWNNDRTEQKNKEVFDEDVKIHGHNYILSIPSIINITPNTDIMGKLIPIISIVTNVIPIDNI